jgi:hypothetical protein
MRYEVEQAGAGDEHEPDVGTHAEPERWHVVNVFNADAVPMPLRFDTLEQALAYVVRMPGTLRASRSTTKASACRWTAAGTATPRLGRRGRSPSSAGSTGSAPSRRGGGSEMCACRRRSMEGYVSLGSSPTGLVRRTSRAFVVGVAVRTPRTTLDGRPGGAMVAARREAVPCPTFR